jgi:hypothetical protein
MSASTDGRAELSELVSSALDEVGVQCDSTDLAIVVLSALRSLPVKQRMEAMGMEPTVVEYGNQGWPNHRYVTGWVPVGTSRSEFASIDHPKSVGNGPDPS